MSTGPVQPWHGGPIGAAGTHSPHSQSTRAAAPLVLGIVRNLPARTQLLPWDESTHFSEWLVIVFLLLEM